MANDDLTQRNHDLVDRPGPIRPGEELAVERLGPFLRDAVPGLDGDLEVLQFPAGHSNLTYLLRFGDRELILRRPPHGRKPKSGHDMKREFTVLRALRDAFPYCPRVLAMCDDDRVLGCPFYVMERLRGIIVRRTVPSGLLRSPDDARVLFERFVDVLVELHSLDYRQLGLADFGSPEGYVQRQVLGWSERYRRARTPDVPDAESVMVWLADQMPAESDRACLIHNDYKLDNVVLDPDDPLRIVGVLDWEMATIGDPMMDLGETLAYWIEADDPSEFHSMRMMPTDVDGALTRRQIVARYAERSGTSIDRLDFYYCFGLFRIVVILQQIYYRYYRGQSHDLRCGMFSYWITLIEQRCREVIERSEL